MKWLIFLMLISCGKNETPKTKDLFDNDGDEILNYEEEGLEQNIANTAKLGKIYGSLTFKTKSQGIFEIPFDNQVDLKKLSLELVTKNIKYIPKEDYFSEWAKLRFKSLEAKPIFDSLIYEVNLLFSAPISPSYDLVLKGIQDHKNFGRWSSKMSLHLTREELNSLLENKSTLALKSHSEDSIAKKTFRVFYNDGQEEKIFYVSKELSFDNFLKDQNITTYQAADDFDFFFLSEDTSEQWWVRDLKDGDFVVSKASVSDLKASFLSGYKKINSKVERIDGRAASRIQLKNYSPSKVYLKISPTKTIRSFQRRTEVMSSGNGRDGWTKCRNYYMGVKSEEIQTPNYQEFLGQIILTSNDSSVSHDTIFQSQFEKADSSWTWKFDSLPDNFSISLINSPNSTNVTIGLVETTCSKPLSGSFLNQEKNFTLDIEAYVEKLE